MRRDDRITFDATKKFDLQLSQGLIAERKLAEIFTAKKIERIELKTESWLWERTGNICIEFSHNGQPSGISATDADYWVHELNRDGTLCYLMFPVERLRDLVTRARLLGRCRRGGDGDRSLMALIPLSDILA